MLYPLGRASLGSAGASVSNLKPLVLVELFAAANTSELGTGQKALGGATIATAIQGYNGHAERVPVMRALDPKETSHGRSHCVAAMPCAQWRIPVSQLLCSRPLDDWDERAVCRRDRCRGTVAQFITGYRQDALLFSRVPIGKRRAYDIES